MSAAANAAGWLYRVGLIGPLNRKLPPESQKPPKPVQVTYKRRPSTP